VSGESFLVVCTVFSCFLFDCWYLQIMFDHSIRNIPWSIRLENMNANDLNHGVFA